MRLPATAVAAKFNPRAALAIDRYESRASAGGGAEINAHQIVGSFKIRGVVRLDKHRRRNGIAANARPAISISDSISPCSDKIDVTAAACAQRQ